jgi:DNA-binding MarR family transcriptional regulator
MSNEKRQDMLTAVARGVAEFQHATDLVDDAVAQRLGINRTDQRCLGQLFSQGAMGAGQLAAASQLSPGAMTAALDRLERIGYIRRVRSLADRRSVIVELTAIAHRRIEEFYGPIGRAGVAQLEQYTDAELALLRDFLQKGQQLQLEYAARVRSMTDPPDPPAMDDTP